jgi:hypothetical protein
MTYLLGNHVVDWSSLGIWATAFATTAAVLVARYQLEQLREDARLKNSLQIIGNFYKNISFFGVSMSPFEAVSNLSALIDNDEELAGYRGALESHLMREVAWGSDAVFIRQRAYGSIALNYFSMVSALFSRNRLDREMVLGKLGDTARHLLVALNKLDDQEWNLEDLQEFVAAEVEFRRGETTEPGKVKFDG